MGKKIITTAIKMMMMMMMMIDRVYLKQCTIYITVNLSHIAAEVYGNLYGGHLHICT